MPGPESAKTPARQFRLGDQTMATLDALSDHYDGISRAEVIRLAVRDLASRAFGPGWTAPPRVAKKQRRAKNST